MSHKKHANNLKQSPSLLLSPEATPHHGSRHQRMAAVGRAATPTQMRRMDSYSEFHDAITDFSSSNPEIVREHVSNSLRLLRKRDLAPGCAFLVLTTLATAVLNAAIVVFGMGISVGLIIGDSLRRDEAPSTASNESNINLSPQNASVVVVSPATACSRSIIQRGISVPNPVPDRPTNNMPAQ